jgi:RHS repeat-associated protein
MNKTKRLLIAAAFWSLGALAGPATATANVQLRATAFIADGSTYPVSTWSAYCYFYPPTPPPDTGWGWSTDHTFWWRRCGSNLSLDQEVVLSYSDNVPASFNDLVPYLVGGEVVGPYHHTTRLPTCNGNICHTAIGLYARLGSIHGYVRLRDGTPVPAAVYAFNDAIIPTVTTTVTDVAGHYTFTNEDPLYQQNNWGLDLRYVSVNQGGVNGGHGNYVVMAAPASIPTPRQTDPYPWGSATVGSSQLYRLDLTVYSLDDWEGPDGRGDPEEEEDKEERPEEDKPDDESKPNCNEAAPSPTVGNPINLITGNVFIDQTDAAVSGVRRTVRLRRSYNSRRAFVGRGGAFGPGWTHSYEKAVTPLSAVLLKVDPGTGGALYFQDNDGDQTFEPTMPAFERSSVVKIAGGYVRHFKEGGREHYDSQGRLITQHDRVGNLTQIQRDGSGKISAIVAPGGRALTFTYDGDRIATLSGPEGLIASYNYGSGQRLTGVGYDGGGSYSFVPDASGQILSVSDGTGRIVEKHTYENARGLTSELADGAESYSVNYLSPGVAALVTRGDGRTTTYSFQQNAGVRRLRFLTGPCDSCGGGQETRQWSYDTKDRVISAHDSLGRVQTFEYDDAKSLLSSRTNLGARTTSYTRDSYGRALIRTGADNKTTTRTYSDAGVLTITDPLNRVTTIAYNASGLPESITNARNKATHFEYNTAGDLTAVVDPLGKRTTFERDSLGRRTAIVDPLLNRTEITYHRRGWVSRITYPDGTHSDFVHDNRGRRIEAIGPSGRKTTYAYDPQGRTRTVTDAAGNATAFDYDIMSRLVSITDPRGQITRYTYDTYNRVTSTLHPGGRSEAFTYDAVGRLQSRTDRKGTVTTYAYDDDKNELERLSYSDGTPAMAFSYDVVGRLLTADNGTDVLGWAYDAAGQLTAESSQRNGTTVAYTYNPAGSRETLSIGGSSWLGYVYDDADRLTRIDRGPHAFEFGYDDGYRRTSLTHPNGVTTTYGYDTLSRLLSIIATHGPDETSRAVYSYDSASHRMSKETGDYTETYGYDAAERLGSVTRSGANQRQWFFGYDPVGNRTTSQVDTDVRTSTYNLRNELVSAAGGGALVVRGQTDEAAAVTVNGNPARLLPGNLFEATVAVQPGTNTITVAASDARDNVRTNTYETVVANAAESYTYDHNGNLLTRVRGGATWSYEWNARNELKRVLRDGSEVARFEYDPVGRRVSKVAGGVTTSWAYDGADILRETVTGGGGGTFKYVHGPGVDEPLARETAAGGSLAHYHADGLGSITTMTDHAGGILLTRRYDVWGNLESGASTPGYAFTGREWDPEVGLYYYRARYYDSTIGRFISEDPIGFDGGLNPYSYVGNTPALATDPNGLKARVTVTGNRVVITLKVQYKGTGATPEFKRIYEAAVRRFWNRKCGEYDVSVTFEPGTENTIYKNVGTEVVYAGDPDGGSSYDAINWGTQPINGSDKLPVPPLDQDWVLAHETGHLMNLKDHVGEPGANEIMGPYLAPVSDQTIRRVIGGGDGPGSKNTVVIR